MGGEARVGEREGARTQPSLARSARLAAGRLAQGEEEVMLLHLAQRGDSTRSRLPPPDIPRMCRDNSVFVRVLGLRDPIASSLRRSVVPCFMALVSPRDTDSTINSQIEKK